MRITEKVNNYLQHTRRILKKRNEMAIYIVLDRSKALDFKIGASLMHRVLLMTNLHLLCLHGSRRTHRVEVVCDDRLI